MRCLHPLKAYRKPGGGVAFSNREGYVDRHIELPCGQCKECRLKRSREWSLRCMHEAQLHEHNCFITLTYDQAHVPKNGGLDVEHWKLFAKRLRKRMGQFRDLHCGEYGEENFRPHYHACLFGIDFHQDRRLWKAKPYATFVSETLEETWGKGFTTIGNLTRQSAAYVARYVMKKATGDLAKEQYRRIDPDTGEEFFVRSEYITMSRRPGIGAKWIEKFHSDVYPHDEVVEDGQVHRPPKYYDKYLEENNSRMMEELKEKRRRKADKNKSEDTYERRKVRETVLEARLGTQRRNL